MNCKVVEGCRAINQPQTYFTEQSILQKYHPNLPIDVNKMKLSLASSFLILTLSISTSTADDESFRPRHRRTKGGKGNKAGKEHQQCEMIEVIWRGSCSLVNPDPFGDNNRETNAIGSTNFQTIYDAPIGDFDGSITSPPVGIRFVSAQTEPQTNKVATPYPNVESPYYSLAAGFLLDPTTNDIGLNDTLYESSIYYQEYKYYNKFDLDEETEQIVRFPIVGGTGRYACASGEIVRSDVYYFEAPNCSYRSYKLRVCNTCPDPNVAKWH